MKQPLLVKAIEELVDLKLRAVDILIDELVEPISDIGNPEQLIKKPYEEWTPEDLAWLGQIYGQVEPNPLSELIFRKTLERVKQHESEVG